MALKGKGGIKRQGWHLKAGVALLKGRGGIIKRQGWPMLTHLPSCLSSERQRADSSHTRALALKGEADQIQKRMQEAKARQLDRWRVHFSKLQKRWRTMVDSAIQPLGGDPPKDQPLTPSLSAKNSLIHHHTRISSRDPRRKISVANTPKPTQCVRFNMEPEVHLFSKDVGGHDDDGGLGTGVSEHGETSAQEEGVVVRDLEPVGVAV